MLTSSSNTSEAVKLFETVVQGGYCVGCGACAAVSDSPIQMKLNEYGQLCATVDTSTDLTSIDASVQSVCPFSDQEMNEDRLGQELFGKDCKHHNQIGYYLSTYAGFVSEGDYRDRGSSGGMGTWIVSNLLSQGLVDGVVHVHQRQPDEHDPRLFHYELSTTVEQVRASAKSRYYPIELSEVMQLVRDRPGRYAIVGIPCFIKAVRLLMREDQILSERIRFCVGLVCGHLKSMKFAEMFAWECGIEPGNLLSFDFRKKSSDADANQYGIEAVGLKDGQVVTYTSPVRELYGHDWGLGFFKYKACDYCDDVMAETADVVVGDAWLPQYVKDSQGTNVIVVRHPLIQKMIEQGLAEGQLKFDQINADEVARSQRSGFSHRREGLAYRLHLTDRKGEWRPTKRVEPSDRHLSRNLQKRHAMRVMLAAESHAAFKEAVKAGSFSTFVQRMEPLVQRYKSIPSGSSWKHWLGKLKKLMLRLLGA
jgi:coenzyme F420-reducing hydrogenase beta subunit